MTYFLITFIFLIEMALAACLVWAWSQLRARMRELEQKAAEALDEQDLMDFQEKVGGLLGEVREAGAAIISEIDRRRAGLEREGARARDAEKKLAGRIQSMDKAETRLKKELEELALDFKAGAPRTKAKPAKAAKPAKPPKAGNPPPAAPPEQAELPEISAFRAGYRIREFRAPEPQAPVSPTASRYLKVYELADKGLSREAIARASGYLPGEVELILNLRPKSGGQA